MKPIIPINKSREGQFVITTNDSFCDFSVKVKLRKVNVFFNDDTNYIEVSDKHNELIGVVIGVIVDNVKGRVVTPKLNLTFGVEEIDFINQLEELLYSFSGSWLFILATDLYERVYLDPCGSQSLVYDVEKKLAASTVGLILNDTEYLERYDEELYETLNVDELGWIPGGLTAHIGVSRLICNHYLDLAEWKMERHWPVAGFKTGASVDKVSKRIVEIIHSTIKSLHSDGSVVLALTGGMDSRLLLSTCKDFVSKIDTFTIAFPGSKKDVYLAKLLASSNDTVRHSVYPPIYATEVQRDEWLYKASNSIGGVNQYNSPSLGPIAKNKYFISGAAGEIGRAFLWRHYDDASTELNATGLIARLGLSFNEKLKKVIEEWLDGVIMFDSYTILDLAYTELRVSSWAFAQSYAYCGKGNMTQVSPFSNRELISLLFSLSPENRRSEAYIVRGIETTWPKLLKVPFNKYGDIRDKVDLIRKVLTPKVVFRKLKKLYIGL